MIHIIINFLFCDMIWQNDNGLTDVVGVVTDVVGVVQTDVVIEIDISSLIQKLHIPPP